MRKKNLFRDYLEAAIIAVILSLFVRTFLFEAFKIPTPSMQGTLMVGDHIIVDKFGLGARLDFEGGFIPMRPARRGEVIVFKFEREPEKDYVKRIVALPGDEVRVENKILFINGQAVNEPYVQHVDKEMIPERDNMPAVKVPPDHYFVIGDNRDNSADSREWGFVSRGQIRGRALFVYWSIDPQTASGPGGTTGSPGAPPETASAFGALSKTRWDRTFLVIR